MRKVNDATLMVRLPSQLLTEFQASCENASKRVRWLIERDLGERARKRRPGKIAPGEPVVASPQEVGE